MSESGARAQVGPAVARGEQQLFEGAICSLDGPDRAHFLAGARIASLRARPVAMAASRPVGRSIGARLARVATLPAEPAGRAGDKQTN